MTKKQKAKDKYLQKTYGITLADYNRMLREQNQSCDLCKKHKSSFTKALAVDHDHRSGLVRGAICYRCNRFIVGRHNLETVTNLYNYMVKHYTKKKD